MCVWLLPWWLVGMQPVWLWTTFLLTEGVSGIPPNLCDVPKASQSDAVYMCVVNFKVLACCVHYWCRLACQFGYATWFEYQECMGMLTELRSWHDCHFNASNFRQHSLLDTCCTIVVWVCVHVEAWFGSVMCESVGEWDFQNYCSTFKVFHRIRSCVKNSIHHVAHNSLSSYNKNCVLSYTQPSIDQGCRLYVLM